MKNSTENYKKIFSKKRQRYVLDLINETGGITTVDLAKKLRASEATIRRDLNILQQNTEIIRTHGGAIPKALGTSYEPPYRIKEFLHKKEKILIGKSASSLIEEGDTVIFDSGTTVYQATHYSREKTYTCVSLDLPVAMELANSQTIDLIVLGGRVRIGIYAIIGAFAEEMLKKLHVDKFFLGADAVDLKKGITNATLAEVPVKQLCIQAAKEVILVVDSWKFNKTALVQVCDLNQIDMIITDENLPEDLSWEIKEMNIEVIIAKENYFNTEE